MSSHERAEGRVRDALERLTGFAHAVFFQTGTAAIEAVLSVLTRRGDRVAIPGLGCWTLPFAVTKLGRSASFCDVDPYWGADFSSVPCELALAIDPWGGPADWFQLEPRCAPPLVVDVTLSPGARLRGQAPAERCVAGVISLGFEKPLSIGGGGVALFRDQRSAQEARRLFRFGFEDGQWTDRVDRYGFSPYLFPALAASLHKLSRRTAADDRADDVRQKIGAMGLSSNTLRPGGAWGFGNCIPICLPPDFPLSAGEIEAVAVSSAVQLARHPVAPAYLQRAWRRRPQASCPRAEHLSPRLLFFRPSQLSAQHLLEFLARLLEKPEQFRSPFPLPRAHGSLPVDIERLLPRTKLVRSLDGGYGLLAEAENLLWPIDEREAAIVQAIEQRGRRRVKSIGAGTGGSSEI